MTDSLCCKLYLITILNFHGFCLNSLLTTCYIVCSELKTFKKLVVLGLYQGVSFFPPFT